MNVKILNDLYLKIKTSIPEVRHCKRWNNQLIRLADEISFPLPALFIEFIDINIEGLAGRNKLYRYNIRFHLVYDSLRYEDLMILELKEKIVRILEGYAPIHSAPMILINESEDYNHDFIYSYQLVFQAVSKLKIEEDNFIILEGFELDTNYDAGTSSTSGLTFNI